MERKHRASKNNSATLELGILGSLAILWGSPFALTKVGLETITPVTLVAARVALAAIVLWAAVIFLMGWSFRCRWGLAKELLVHACLNCGALHADRLGPANGKQFARSHPEFRGAHFVWLIAWLWTRTSRSFRVAYLVWLQD